MQPVIDMFNLCNKEVQIVVYALALQREQYELLAVLDPLIPKEQKKEFLTQVNKFNNT